MNVINIISAFYLEHSVCQLLVYKYSTIQWENLDARVILGTILFFISILFGAEIHAVIHPYLVIGLKSN